MWIPVVKLTLILNTHRTSYIHSHLVPRTLPNEKWQKENKSFKQISVWDSSKIGFLFCFLQFFCTASVCCFLGAGKEGVVCTCMWERETRKYSAGGCALKRKSRIEDRKTEKKEKVETTCFTFDRIVWHVRF